MILNKYKSLQLLFWFLKRIKMNPTCFLLVFSIVVAVSYSDDGKYTTKYDNIDLDEILKSDRLLKNYFECVMDRGNCTPDGAELKSEFEIFNFLNNIKSQNVTKRKTEKIHNIAHIWKVFPLVVIIMYVRDFNT